MSADGGQLAGMATQAGVAVLSDMCEERIYATGAQLAVSVDGSISVSEAVGSATHQSTAQRCPSVQCVVRIQTGPGRHSDGTPRKRRFVVGRTAVNDKPRSWLCHRNRRSGRC